MANRYWVGGTANWDGTAGTKWATTSGGTGGAAVPTFSDDVFFDANSGVVVVTTTGSSAVCANFNCTGFTGTLTGSSLSIGRSATFSSGMTYSVSAITFTSGVTGNVITTAGKNLLSVNFDTAGSEWIFADNFLSTSITHYRGTIDTNGWNVTGNYLSSGLGLKTLTLGASQWTGTWNAATGPLTVNPGTSLIITNGSFYGGGKTYYDIAFNPTTINDSNTFNSFTSTKSITFVAGTTTTATSWFLTGSLGNMVQLWSSSAGSTYTLATTNNVNASYVDIKDSIATTANKWYASQSINSGNNSGWTFLQPSSFLVLL